VEDSKSYFAENKLAINVNNRNEIPENLELQKKHINMYDPF